MSKKCPATYVSPRWTGELCDCSMPMTFDTYSICSYNCLYCFAFFQKAPSMKDSYLDRKVSSVSVRKFRDLLWLALRDTELGPVTKGMSTFIPYISQRKVMQWGGMADPLDEYERRFGVTLQLLRLFDEFDYPLSISTKGTWWTEDERYMELVRAHPHNWHFKLSIITEDPMKARGVERGCPSPQERLLAIKRLADAGAHVTLRLRPYILGVSDDWRSLITAGAEAGADSVTTEFFCVEGRAAPPLKARYRELGKFAGMDILPYYKANSTRKGYYRLNYTLKEPIIEGMRAHAHHLGLRFYVSDADHKAACDYSCCCGVPPEWNTSRGQFTTALMKAKHRKARGEEPRMYWSDIAEEAESLLGHIDAPSSHGTQVARATTLLRARYAGFSLSEWMRDQWNSPNTSGFSPAKYFGAPVKAVGLDPDGNVVYELDVKHIDLKHLPGEEEP